VKNRHPKKVSDINSVLKRIDIIRFADIFADINRFKISLNFAMNITVFSNNGRNMIDSKDRDVPQFYFRIDSFAIKNR